MHFPVRVCDHDADAALSRGDVSSDPTAFAKTRPTAHARTHARAHNLSVSTAMYDTARSSGC